MTGKDLIIELLKLDTEDLDKKVNIYCLIKTIDVDVDVSEFELIGSKLELGIDGDGDIILIEGYFEKESR